MVALRMPTAQWGAALREGLYAEAVEAALRQLRWLTALDVCGCQRWSVAVVDDRQYITAPS